MKTALVTGGSRGIGRSIALRLARDGFRVIVNYASRADAALAVVREIEGAGGHASAVQADVSDAAQVTRMAGVTGPVDVLINNAAFVGTSSLQGWALPFEQQSVETWRRALEVNVTAVFDLCKQLTGLMRESTCASIINVGSIYGLYGPDWHLYEGTDMGNPAAYAASKGGLIQLTRWLATTLAPQIRVNCISPGGIFRKQPSSFVKRYEAHTPLGRMAHEDDVRGAIAYLASDLSKYVTGQNIAVDGGWGVW